MRARAHAREPRCVRSAWTHASIRLCATVGTLRRRRRHWTRTAAPTRYGSSSGRWPRGIFSCFPTRSELAWPRCGSLTPFLPNEHGVASSFQDASEADAVPVIVWDNEVDDLDLDGTDGRRR